jgi:membrane fusion protein
MRTMANTPRTELFRTQAVDAQRGPGYGSIQLARPVSFSVLTVCALVCAGGLVAYTTFGSFTRKVHVQGILVPQSGITKVFSPQGGVVYELSLREGQSVKQGAVLAVINTERSSQVGSASVQSILAEQIQHRLKSFQEEEVHHERLSSEQATTVRRRIDALQSEVSQLQREMQTQRGRVEISEKNVARYENLVLQNYVSPSQLAQHQSDRLEQQARLQQLERGALSVKRDLALAEGELTQIPLRLQTQRQNIARSRASLNQEIAENASRAAVKIIAPHDGVVTNVLAQPGNSVNANTPLLSLLPADAVLEAHLFAPSQAVGFINSEQPVLLRYAAYPYQKFGHQSGRVAHVSKTALHPSELVAAGFTVPAGGGSQAEPLYRVTVKIDAQNVLAYGKAQSLSAGMMLDASIQQEQRKLWEWVLEPLYSIAGKV